MFRSRIFVLAALLFGLIYFLISPLLFFLSERGVAPVSIRVYGIPYEDISVELLSAKGNEYCASYEKGEGFCQKGSHLYGFSITFPEKRLSNLESVEIQVGEIIHFLSKKDVSDKIKFSASDPRHFILESSDIVSPIGSVVPMLDKCITWEGDISFVCNSWLAFLPLLSAFLLYLVLNFVSRNSLLWVELNSIKIISASFVGMLLLSFFYVGRICHTIDDFTIINQIRFGEFTICMGSVLGCVLSVLYRHVSTNIGWYGWMLYCVNMASLLIILISIYKFIKNRLVCLTVSLLVLGMFFYLFTELTFTMSSVLMSGASLITITISFIRGHPRYSRVIGLGFLLALGYSIRTKAILSLGLFICPVLFYLLLRAGRLKDIRIWHRGVVFLIPFLLIIIAETLVIPLFRSEEDKSYFTHAMACVPPHDYSLFHGENERLLEKNNWSENDYEMFDKWMYFDEDKYSLDKIRNIQNTVHRFPSKQALFRNIFFVCFAGWNFFVPCALLMLISHVRKANCIEFFGVVLLFSFLSYLMYLFIKFPIRLSYPLSMLTSVLGCLVIFGRSNVELSRQRAIMLLMVGVAFFAQCVVKGVQCKDELISKKLELKQSVSDVTEICSGGVIVTNSNGFYFWHHDPLFPPKYVTTIMDNVQLAGGWRIFSPVFYRKLESIGLNSGRDLLVNLYKNPKFYFLCEDKYSENLLKYLQENYDSRVKIVEKHYVSPGRSVFRYAVSECN